MLLFSFDCLCIFVNLPWISRCQFIDDRWAQDADLGLFEVGPENAHACGSLVKAALRFTTNTSGKWTAQVTIYQSLILQSKDIVMNFKMKFVRHDKPRHLHEQNSELGDRLYFLQNNQHTFDLALILKHCGFILETCIFLNIRCSSRFVCLYRLFYYMNRVYVMNTEYFGCIVLLLFSRNVFACISN